MFHVIQCLLKIYYVLLYITFILRILYLYDKSDKLSIIIKNFYVFLRKVQFNSYFKNLIKGCKFFYFTQTNVDKLLKRH